MSSSELLVLLRKVQMFEGLTEEHLQQLALISRGVDMPQAAVVFREGDLATSVYLVVRGRVSLEICAPSVGCKRFQTVHEGELLAWSPILENDRLTATARTLAPTRLIEIGGEDIRALFDEYPRLGHQFMRCAALALCKRLSATRLQLLNLYGDEHTASQAATEENGGAP